MNARCRSTAPERHTPQPTPTDARAPPPHASPRSTLTTLTVGLYPLPQQPGKGLAGDKACRRGSREANLGDRRTDHGFASDNGSSVNRIAPVFPGVSPRNRDYGDVAAPVIRLESTARRSRSAARAAASAWRTSQPRGSAAPPQARPAMAMPAPTMRQVSVARSPADFNPQVRKGSVARHPDRGVGDDWQANGLIVYFCTNGVGTLSRRSGHAPQPRACAGRLEEMRSSRRPRPSSPVASTTAPALPSPSLSSAASRAVRTISRHAGGISIGPVYASRSSR